MSFTSIETLWEEIKSTGLHQVEDRDAEFSLSVGVFPYPCGVFSVWIYIAAFVKEGKKIY